ncbi:histidine kinase [Paenibacillus sp. LHD-117]|uniref:sensor histidine kinase n=1 Tax=Paenibacillus sp. LHD-117 TaxID=3071412 RepID=UPI0027DF22CF|nr:histidine kinase [Paenibacillus sp. LHD-117]MDQ6422721.1 histidine kinase [Paenibacillus sp. LHD-117]
MSKISDKLQRFVTVIRQTLLVRVLFLFLLLFTVLVLILGQVIISKVESKILSNEYRYQNQILTKWQSDFQLKLAELRKWTRTFYAEDYSGLSMLDRIEQYKETYDSENIVISKAIDHFLETLAYSKNDVASLWFIRESDQANFRYERNSGRVNPAYLDFVSRYNTFGRDQYVKVVPYSHNSQAPNKSNEDGIVSVFLRLDDIHDLKQSKHVGTLVVNLNSGIMVHPENEDAVYAFQIDNRYGKAVYPPSFESQLESGSYFQIKLDKSADDLRFSSWASEARLFHDSEQIRYIMWGLLTLLFLFTLCLIGYATGQINGRLQTIRKALKRIQNGVFNQPIAIKKLDEFTEIERTLNKMTDKLTEYIDREYLFEIEAKNVEIQALQAQINPHFLSNTLEIFRLQAMKQNNIQLSEMLFDFSEFLRWSIKNRDTLIPIFEEFHYVELYIRLQASKLRNLSYVIDVDESVTDYMITKLCIQPIVENIFKHASLPSIPKAVIRIAVKDMGEEIGITIKNNGKQISKERLDEVRLLLAGHHSPGANTSIGLTNVNRRLKLLFKDNYRMELSSDLDKGTNVFISIPKLSREGE